MESIFEELNLYTPYQQVSFICSTQFHEQTKVKMVEYCKCIIGDINTCMCHLIKHVHHLGSNDLTFSTIMKTKEICGICQWSVPRLYHFIQKMPFHQINQICDPRKLLSNSRVLNDRRIFTQIFHQFELEDAVIQDILPRMHNSILFDILSKNIMDTIKTEEKNCTGITKSLNNYFFLYVLLFFV